MPSGLLPVWQSCPKGVQSCKIPDCQRCCLSHSLKFWLFHASALRTCGPPDIQTPFFTYGSTRKGGKGGELNVSALYCGTIESVLSINLFSPLAAFSCRLIEKWGASPLPFPLQPHLSTFPTLSRLALFATSSEIRERFTFEQNGLTTKVTKLKSIGLDAK